MKTHFVSYETNSVYFVDYAGAMYIIRHLDSIFFLYYVRPEFLEPFLIKVKVQWDQTLRVLLSWRLTPGNPCCTLQLDTAPAAVKCWCFVS